MRTTQLSFTVKNSIDSVNTKPMTYSCLNTTVSLYNLSFENSPL
jgi:hypothetical protein